MKDLTEPFGFVGGLAERLPEPADFGLALAEGFARRIGMLSRRLGASSDAARWAARAAFAASRATAAGHVCIALGALAQRYDTTLEAVRAELAASGVVASGRAARGADSPLVVDADGRLYLARYFDYETRLADALVMHARAASAVSAGLPPPEQLRASLERFFTAPAAGEIDWQRVAAAVALGGSVTIVSGGPGTGKTTTVVGVIACLIELQPALRIALAAPTGKAAQRMQEALHARASNLPPELAARLPNTSCTLHRLLGWLPGGRFRHHRDNPLPCDLVVVDEASMIDVALAAHLFDALAPGARLVLLGDKDQLAAVEAGAVFAELSARPAFSAAGCARIAAALGVSVAEFVAALPAEASGPATASPAVAAAEVRAPTRARRAARTAPPAQASLFDFDDAAPPHEAPAAPIDAAFAGASLDAWIEPAELAWLDAWHVDGPDGGPSSSKDVPLAGTGLEPANTVAAAAPSTAPLADSVVWLERNYRFGLDSPIGRLSLAIRGGDAQAALATLSPGTEAQAAARFFEDAGEALAAATLERLAQGFSAYGAVLRAALAAAEPDPLPLFDALNRFRILCATRSGARGADEVNLRVAALVRRAVQVPLAVGAHWFAGRPVMVTRNDYALGLFNGDIGIALPDARGALRVWFRGADGQLRAVAPAALPPHDTAFALTVHKSQGSEFDEAALVLPAGFGRVLSRELVYTAITRARSRVQVIGPRAVLAQAIAARTRRDTGLAARMAEAAARHDEQEAGR